MTDSNESNIVLIGPTYPYRGGIAHHTAQLYEHLKQRHTVTFISYKKQYPAWLYPGKTDIDPSRTALSSYGALRIIDSTNPFTWLQAVRILIRANADFLILPWWVAYWTPMYLFIISLTKIFTKTRIIFICHNVVEHESSFLKKFLTKSVLRWGTRFVVHSQEDENNLRAIIPAANISRLFLPVGTFAEYTGKLSQQDAQKKLCISGKKVILFFGFIREYKGLRYLLEAMPDLLKNDPDIFLIIAGEFWKDKQTYLDLINNLNINQAIRIIDTYIPNEQVPVYFKAADVVAIPYTSATGSAIIQTAYDFGKPVVATKVGNISDIVHDGATGILVEPANVEQLTNAITTIFQNNRYKTFEQNLLSAQQSFTWDVLIDRLDEIMGYVTKKSTS